MDCFGNFKEKSFGGKTYLLGTYVPHFKNVQDYPRFPNISLPNGGKTYWIGYLPGQISKSWIDLSWTPHWMIYFKTHKKAIAYYLGNSEQLLINGTKNRFSKEKIQDWKRTIWDKRMRIKLHPQSKKSEKQKWKDLLKDAKYA